MKVREILYFGASSLLSPLIRRRPILCALSAFSFPTKGGDSLEIGLTSWIKRYGPPTFIATLLLLLGVNLVWSLLSGRALPNADESIYNFLEDWPNILNYSILCPTYVTLCIAFLIHIRKLRSSLRDTGLGELLGIDLLDHRPSPWNYLLTVMIVGLACTLSISGFVAELAKYEVLFWFQRVSPGGEKVLTGHGYYYLVTNLFLNLIVMLAAAAHFELFAVAARIGEGLRAFVRKDQQPPNELLDETSLRRLLRPFTALYVISKLIVAVIIANMYTWRAQQPSFTGMLELTIVAIALLGFAIVSYPRYHIQYWVFRLWNRYDRGLYPELRPPLAVGLASLLDIIILGGMLTNLLVYALEKAGLRFDFL